MAVNRMVPRNGIAREVWANRLDQTFGDGSWRQEVYEIPSEQQSLFPDFESRLPNSKVADPFGRLSK